MEMSDKAFANGSKVYEADYYVPLLAHAPMEPLVALAEFKDGKVHAWAPTQNPQAVQAIVSKELGIAKEDVICHVTLLGGGFGRKSKPDYVAEAAVLSQKIGRPVKVVWTREDDIKFDYYNAVAVDVYEGCRRFERQASAGCSARCFLRFTSIFDVNAVYGDRGPSAARLDRYAVRHLPNLRVENGPAKAHMFASAGCARWRISITRSPFRCFTR